MGAWMIWPVACVIVAAISFVLGGIYFMASAKAHSPSAPAAKVERLVGLACGGGAFVATEDNGKTMVVATMSNNAVVRVRLYQLGGREGSRGLHEDVGATLVSHVVGERSRGWDSHAASSRNGR